MYDVSSSKPLPISFRLFKLIKQMQSIQNYGAKLVLGKTNMTAAERL